MAKQPSMHRTHHRMRFHQSHFDTLLWDICIYFDPRVLIFRNCFIPWVIFIRISLWVPPCTLWEAGYSQVLTYGKNGSLKSDLAWTRIFHHFTIKIYYATHWTSSYYTMTVPMSSLCNFFTFRIIHTLKNYMFKNLSNNVKLRVLKKVCAEKCWIGYVSPSVLIQILCPISRAGRINQWRNLILTFRVIQRPFRTIRTSSLLS